MGDQTHHNNINTQLSGFFTGNTAPDSGAGGSFAFTESNMRTIIKNWLDLGDSYQQSTFNAAYMTRVEPPAEDFASRFHAAAANQSGESYLKYIKHNQDYCYEQAQLFQNALDDYLGVEHTNVTEMNKTAPQGPQPGV